MIYGYKCQKCKVETEEMRDVMHRFDVSPCQFCDGERRLIIYPVMGQLAGGPTVPSGRRRHR